MGLAEDQTRFSFSVLISQLISVIYHPGKEFISRTNRVRRRLGMAERAELNSWGTPARAGQWEKAKTPGG